MANFEIPLTPEFSSQVRKFETTDPAHAALFNSVIEILINNDVFLRAVAEQLVQNLQQHISDSQTTLNTYYQQSTGYTDQKIAGLINGAPSTLDTLGEIAQAMANNAEVVDAIEAAIGSKANQAEIESLLGTKMEKTGDSKDNKTTFSSSDTLTPSAWTDVAVLKSGETHKSIFGKISAMFKNIRYIWNLLYAISASGAITEVQIVDTLPSDAASHPTTFYWVKG